MKNIVANKNMLILGAGQYGQVAKEVVENMNCFEKIDFLDDNNEIAIEKLSEFKKFVNDYSYAFVAIGNTSLRLSYIEKLEVICYKIPILLSAKAHVALSVQLMKGTIVEPMAVVNANSAVSVAVFVCAGAIVNQIPLSATAAY